MLGGCSSHLLELVIGIFLAVQSQIARLLGLLTYHLAARVAYEQSCRWLAARRLEQVAQPASLADLLPIRGWWH